MMRRLVLAATIVMMSLGLVALPLPASATTVPDAPTILSANVYGTSGYVQWQTGSDGGSAAGYTIIASPGGRASSNWWTSGDPTHLFGYVAGLELGTTYTFRVIASNENGDSQPSAPSAPVAGPPEDTVPAPNAFYPRGAVVIPSYSPSDASAVLKVEWIVDGVSLCFREFDPFECGLDEGYPSGLVDTTTLGIHTLVLKIWDTELNVRAVTTDYYVFDPDATAGSDTSPPTVSIVRPPDGATYGQGQVVYASYTCDDSGGSGLSGCSGDARIGGAIDTSTPGPHTFSATAVDGAGHSTTVTHGYHVVGDAIAPTITLSDPPAEQTFALNERVSAHFSCADTDGSGVVACIGMANGSTRQVPGELDTTTVGVHSFSVHATDAAGNVSEAHIKYFVGGDTTRPDISVTIQDGATYSLNQPYVYFYYNCWDETDLASCSSDRTNGTYIETSVPGTFSFTIVATDSAGNTRTVHNTYSILDGDLPPRAVPPSGGYFTTDPGGLGATTDTPVQTAIAVPSSTSSTSGTVAITAGSLSDPPPDGYSFLGQQITIQAPSAPDASHPLVITFTVNNVDASLLNVVRTENGVQVTLPDCDAGIPVTASPDPCKTPPEQITSGVGAGDARVTVYTTHASDWNFGIHKPFNYSGFFQPVDNPQTLNSVKAGSAIPVKFSLGGDQGLGVLARAYPVSQKIACSTTAPIDAIEQTVNAGGSSLSFSSSTNQYTYVWKTDSSWSGTCRSLTVKLADGAVHQALFKFTR